MEGLSHSTRSFWWWYEGTHDVLGDHFNATCDGFNPILRAEPWDITPGSPASCLVHDYSWITRGETHHFDVGIMLPVNLHLIYVVINRHLMYGYKTMSQLLDELFTERGAVFQPRAGVKFRRRATRDGKCQRYNTWLSL